MYKIEIRTSFNKEYIKVFLCNMKDSNKIINQLESLDCVKKVNISNEGKDLTVYPKEVFTAKYTKNKIESSLTSYYSNTQNNTIKELSNTIEKIKKHPNISQLLEDACKKLRNSDSKRSILDDTRLALELYLQKVIGNKETLEHQTSRLKFFLKSKNATQEVITGITTSLNNFYRYQNDNVKHANNVKDEDVEYYINVAQNIINQIHKYEDD